MDDQCLWLRALNSIFEKIPQLFLLSFLIALVGSCASDYAIKQKNQDSQKIFPDSQVISDSISGYRLLRVVEKNGKTDSLIITSNRSWQKEFQLIKDCESLLYNNPDMVISADRNNAAIQVKRWQLNSSQNLRWIYGEFRQENSFKEFIFQKRSKDLLFENATEVYCRWPYNDSVSLYSRVLQTQKIKFIGKDTELSIQHYIIISN